MIDGCHIVIEQLLKRWLNLTISILSFAIGMDFVHNDYLLGSFSTLKVIHYGILK